ncbi:MAG TPA: histidine kinase [Cyanobacteria bacterium UBA12227]|nr:histidine kinase [Cyanobacteria bacterium UBA12227]HAX87909.1 histidine kinase [Cyanobacteria bacterium UBA11370]HBY79991.1 histidine kinase [Cyanobacteria bacterium UBA11148]
MIRRSLQASPQGIKKAKHAFLLKGWTQEYLASEVGIETRQPIWKFFAGKPVDRHIFIEICFRLDLEPQEIVSLPPTEELIINENVQEIFSDIKTLVTRVRQERYEQIQDQCGTLRLLDITRPIDLDDLYVDVNILEEIPSQRWLEISDLQGSKPHEFDRLGLGNVRFEGVPGLRAVERYGKLMVLGKPGAGKTTFLQHIAIQCNQGHFQSHLIPIFVQLKHFAEDALDEANFSLIEYINQEFYRCNVSGKEVETILNQGRVLLLLDGLDEVPKVASDRVIQQIRKLSENYYKNYLIITCRIAASEYRFRGFTEVEIADFKPAQIEKFAQKWFVAVAKNSPESGLKKASLFLEQLALPQNQLIKELAVTPVLLNLTCLVFDAKTEFPTKRSDLYKQGLDLLLIRWDEARGIKRDDVYRNLSLSHKLQLLTQLAAITFEQGNYFFEGNTIQQLISQYLLILSDNSLDSASLELNSVAVLKSIEAQHGVLVERARQIYSFSHLTFQEYLTARAIVANPEQSLPKLVKNLTDKRWREVVLLTVQMLPNTERLLEQIKGKIDDLTRELVTPSKKINNQEDSPLPTQTVSQLLLWVKQKSLQVKTPYKAAAVRAFYLTLSLAPNYQFASDQGLALAIDRKLAGELEGELALDLALVNALGVALALNPELIGDRLTALYLALELDCLTEIEPIGDSLRQLKNQLPNQKEDRDCLKQWWQINGQTWISQLRSAMIEHRNIGHEWQLSELEQKQLEQYDYANKLLVDCLNSYCQLTPIVRQKIEDDLLLTR